MENSAAKRIPIADGLFTESPEGPRLIGSKCRGCGEVTFPKQKGCPACTASDAEEVLLSPRGTLWTWTIQRFPPPSPPYVAPRDGFAPYGVGYVELPEGIRIESRLTESDPAKLSIGMVLELVLESHGEDEKGRELTTFAFRPVGRS